MLLTHSQIHKQPFKHFEFDKIDLTTNLILISVDIKLACQRRKIIDNRCWEECDCEITHVIDIFRAVRKHAAIVQIKYVRLRLTFQQPRRFPSIVQHWPNVSCLLGSHFRTKPLYTENAVSVVAILISC